MNTILNRLPNYLFCAFAFLLPVFFLPFTSQPALASQQMLAVYFVFALVCIWLAQIIKTGKVSIVWNRALIAVLCLIVVLGISSLLSISRQQSFWGMNFEPDAFLNFALFGFVFFFLMQAASPRTIDTGEGVNQSQFKKELFLKSFLLSGLLLAVVFLSQLAKPFLPWGFARQVGFNTVGSCQTLALFFAGMLAVLACSLSFGVFKKRSEKIAGIAFGLLLLACLFIINFKTSWVVLLLALAVGFALKLWQNKQLKIYFKSKTNWLAILAIVICLFMLFLGFAKNFVDLPGEATLSHKAAFNITKAALFKNVKNFVFGTGPATFAYNYDLYRPLSINLSNFWNFRFNRGSSFLLDLFCSAGIAGIAALAGLVFLFLKHGWQSFSAKQENNQGVQKTFFIAGFCFLLTLFLYPANFVLAMAGFCFLALFLAGLAKNREINIFSSPARHFLAVCLCLVIFAGAIAVFYKTNKNYLADVYFAKSISTSSQAPEKKLGFMQKAIVLNKKDVYSRAFSQESLAQAEKIFADQTLTAQERTAQLQNAVSQTEKASEMAEQIDPKNYQNLFNLGIIYGNLAKMNIPKAADSAIATLKEAEKLAPQNPQPAFNSGALCINASQRIKNKIAALQKQSGQGKNIGILQNQNSQILAQAAKELQRAIALKPNYSQAYFYLGFTYEMQGNSILALQSYRMVLKFEPNHQEAASRVAALTGK